MYLSYVRIYIIIYFREHVYNLHLILACTKEICINNNIFKIFNNNNHFLNYNQMLRKLNKFVLKILNWV